MIENNIPKSVKNICCIGAGYVGGPTMAVIADRCPSVKVTVVDINKERIDNWNSNDLSRLPVFEPGLDKIIERVRNKNLFFSTCVGQKISEADLIFISVNTPTKTKGIGAGQASDLRWVESCARNVAEFAKGFTIVVEKSTLPVRTASVIKSILSSTTSNSEKKNFAILSNPEFLAEGTAVNDLEKPDRVLIGGEDHQAINLLEEIYLNWVPSNKIIKTNLWSSELSKLVANAFLAQRISSVNSISALSEATGADVREVSRAIGLDTRIGEKFLNAGPGFGGSCFKKDILNLVYLCNYFGLHEVAEYWNQVIFLNNWHQERIYKLIVKKLFGTIIGKKITILGFAFKANTNDTRESPAISLCNNLLEEGAILSIHDPKVSKEQIKKDLPKFSYDMEKLNTSGTWHFSGNIMDSVKGADAVLLITEWDEYKDIDWKAISCYMRKPAWVFDTRSILPRELIRKTGLNLWTIGDGYYQN